jgi:phage terminase large subunit
LWLISGQLTRDTYIPKGVWSTVRKYSTTLDATVIRDFEEELNKHKIFNLIQHNKTKKTYKYGDRLVEFIGADDEQKLRGAKRNILYCNEGNELDFKKEFFQLLMRTEDKVIIDFNPDDENIWINTELEQKRLFEKGDVDVIVSTYKDNTFLPKSLVSEIEYLEKTDPEFWKIYGLGQYGKLFGLIFEDYKVVDKIPDTATLIAYGQDFGFTNDPSAMVGVWKQDGELWIKELIYQRGLTNQDLAIKYRDLGIQSHEEIIADSAEPKSIQELTNQQFRVNGAEKGADSIKNSIDILKRYKLNITQDSSNLIKELRTYKWMLDKTGNSINKPVDYNNHAIDAIRYVALNKLGHNNNGVYHIA